MANYFVHKELHKVLEFSDQPGKITSTALFDEVPDHPFLSGHELDPSEGQTLHHILAQSTGVADFIGRLRTHSYRVELVTPENSGRTLVDELATQ